MSNVKIIGIGSPYGNDSVGWRVIENLKQQHMLSTLLPERVELIETDRPGINLVQLWQGAEIVILIDAILDRPNHGEVRCLSKEELITAHHSVSTHELDVASAIALAEKLNILPEKLLIIGLGIDATQEEPVSEESIYKLTVAVTCEIKNYFAQATLN